jgi:hypothetical protein
MCINLHARMFLAQDEKWFCLRAESYLALERGDLAYDDACMAADMNRMNWKAHFLQGRALDFMHTDNPDQQQRIEDCFREALKCASVPDDMRKKIVNRLSSGSSSDVSW